MSDRLEEMAQPGMSREWNAGYATARIEITSELGQREAQARREGAEARDREWCEAIEPGNADTDLGRTILAGGPEWVRDYLKEKLLLAESEGAEAERARAERIVREEFASSLRAYSADVFSRPEPGQHGRTVDACSAAALRACLPPLCDEILRRLKASEEER